MKPICRAIPAGSLAIAGVSSLAADEPGPPDAPRAIELTAADLDVWLDGFLPHAIEQGDIAAVAVVVVKDQAYVTGCDLFMWEGMPRRWRADDSIGFSGKLTVEHLKGTEPEIVLHVPNCGSTEVILGGFAEQPWAQRVTAHAVGPDGSTANGESRDVGADGRVVFPAVEVGAPLRLQAICDAGTRVAELVVDGPTRKGERITVRMRRGE